MSNSMRKTKCFNLRKLSNECECAFLEFTYICAYASRILQTKIAIRAEKNLMREIYSVMTIIHFIYISLTDTCADCRHAQVA